MHVDIEKIKQLITLIEESSVTEIEIQEEGKSIRIAKTPPNTLQPAPFLQVPMPSHSHQMPFAPPATTPASEGTTTPSDSKKRTIKSPMVGTFYAAPTPDSKPFLTIGQSVEPGNPICIIEAMKMFNEIESDQAGVVTKILVENGQPIEYEQPLFEIE